MSESERSLTRGGPAAWNDWRGPARSQREAKKVFWQEARPATPRSNLSNVLILVRCPFYVGQKVVCIDDSPGAATGLALLTLGAVYTVSWVYPEIIGGEHGIWVAEVPEGLFVPALKCSRFRPVYDDSIFTRLLVRRLSMEQ